MFGWLSKLLIGAGSKLKPSTAADMLKKAGIENMDDLAKFSKKEILNKLGLTKKSGVIGKVVKTAVPAGAGAYGMSLWDRAKKLEKAKGGSVRRMNKGGSVSRGTGAAIKGTKFKGVF
jgi:hypothetical protein